MGSIWAFPWESPMKILYRIKMLHNLNLILTKKKRVSYTTFLSVGQCLSQRGEVYWTVVTCLKRKNMTGWCTWTLLWHVNMEIGSHNSNLNMYFLHTLMSYLCPTTKLLSVKYVNMLEGGMVCTSRIASFPGSPGWGWGEPGNEVTSRRPVHWKVTHPSEPLSKRVHR